MKDSIFKTINSAIKHWYIPLIVGILFLILSFYVWVQPIGSYIALAVIFSISFLLSGIAEIIFSLSNKSEMDNWAWTLAFGIINVLIGILLMANPALSMVTLALYVGFIIVFRSISGISASIELKNYGVANWGWMMFWSILGLVFGFILLWNPLFAGLTLVAWTALGFLTLGIFSISFSLKLKSLKNLKNDLSSRLE